MEALRRSSSRRARSVACVFVSGSGTPWNSGHASSVKCLSRWPPRWPSELHPSTRQRRSSGTAGVRLTGLDTWLALGFVFVFFDLPLVVEPRLTGLFVAERFDSDSVSDSDAFPGLKMAVKCLDLRVLDDRVSLRTTFWLESRSDSELSLSLDSDDLLLLVARVAVDLGGTRRLGTRLLGGDESALDSSVSESLLGKIVE